MCSRLPHQNRMWSAQLHQEAMCVTNYIKRGNGGAPVQEGRVDTCRRSLPGQIPFLSTKGQLCLDLTPVKRVTNDPSELLPH